LPAAHVGGLLARRLERSSETGCEKMTDAWPGRQHQQPQQRTPTLQQHYRLVAEEDMPVITNLYAARPEFSDGDTTNHNRRFKGMRATPPPSSGPSTSAPAVAASSSGSRSSTATPSRQQSSGTAPVRPCCGLCRCNCCAGSRAWCCRKTRSAQRAFVSVARELTWWQQLLLVVFVATGAALSVTLFKCVVVVHVCAWSRCARRAALRACAAAVFWFTSSSCASLGGHTTLSAWPDEFSAFRVLLLLLLFDDAGVFATGLLLLPVATISLCL
jgi:hypothetical protein